MADESEKKLTCKAGNIQTSINGIMGSMSSMIENVMLTRIATEKLVELTEDLKKILEHYHKSHLHPLTHEDGNNYDTESGAAFMSNPTTPAEKLIMEFNTNMDSDGNGLIFGKDFKLTGEDIPKLVKQVNDTLDDKKISRKLSYSNYINTIPNADKLWNL